MKKILVNNPMFHYLTYTYSGKQATIHTSSTWGSLLLRTDLKKVIKDTLVTMPARPRNFRLRKTLSLQVIQAWLERLSLEERGIRWMYWDIPQQDLSSLFEKYRLSDCMGISPPYAKSKYACETFLKTSERYLSQADIDENVLEWVNGDSAPAGMKERLDAFLSQGQEERGEEPDNRKK